MSTVNNNYDVLQRGSFRAGKFWERQLYDEYEWRDYYKDNIDNDERSRYQLWEKSGTGDFRYNGEYNRDEMVADLEKLQNQYKAAEDRREAAERRERLREQEARRAAREEQEARRAGNGRNGWGADMGGFSNMSVLLGRLNQLGRTI
jgi:hypothetical protein